MIPKPNAYKKKTFNLDDDDITQYIVQDADMKPQFMSMFKYGIRYPEYFDCKFFFFMIFID